MSRPINISDLNGRYTSFDFAINRSINDPYCTVYVFKDCAEMMNNWEEIKYNDTITTQYKGK